MSGPFGSSQWMYNPSAGFYGTEIDNSLRFNDDESQYLSWTPAAAGNRKTWTFSAWVKRANVSIRQSILRADGANTDTGQTDIWFDSDDTLLVAGYSTYYRITNQKFRDTSSWFNLCFQFDSTQATADDRLKIFVNGVQITSFSTNNAYTQNTDYGVNQSVLHTLGSGYDYFDGYLSDIYFIDGTALDPTSFGETKSGIWIPKEYSGSYGTNGFHLEFAGNANDSSGNGNNWTANNISAHDYVPDSPTNNFCTNNSVATDTTGSTNHSFSEGNLKVSTSSNNWWNTFGTIGIPSSGKYYWEYRAVGSGTVDQNVGVVTIDWYRGSDGGIDTADAYSLYTFSGGDAYLYTDGSNVNKGTGWAWTWGDVVNFAIDADTGKIWYGINGTWLGSGDPAAGTNQAHTVTSGDLAKGMLPAFSGYWTGGTPVMNFGQDSTFAGATTAGGNSDGNGIGDFKYSVPSGFLALCSANLPELTIDPINDDTPEDYFNTVLYVGDYTTSNSITGVGFSPDFVWIKDRGLTTVYNYSHAFFDTVRGAGKWISSNRTDAENDFGTGTTSPFRSFDADGFTVGQNYNTNEVDPVADYFVSWNWKAGGTAVSNTDGDNTSSVSANTDIGFSIVSYTGSGGEKTVGHGLDQECDMVIVKSRDNTRPWCVMHKDLSSNYNLSLNGSGGQYHFPSQSSNGGIHTPDQTGSTSTTFSLGNGTSDSVNVNGSGEDYIAYCFHSVEGFSKMGSYTGNGSSDGTFVYTGFRPAWLMIKYISANGQEWPIQDNRRLGYNPDNAALFADLTGAEYASNLRYLDLLSNGFKPRNSSTNQNVSGGKYIYIAFAEQPFKYANAR